MGTRQAESLGINILETDPDLSLQVCVCEIGGSHFSSLTPGEMGGHTQHREWLGRTQEITPYKDKVLRLVTEPLI